MYIYFSTLGCKLNYTETSALKQIAKQNGFLITHNINEANIIVVNTCTVTQTADKKSKYAIRRLHKLNPNAKLIVTGCYADTDYEQVKNLEGVSIILTNNQKQDFINALKNFSVTNKNIHTNDFFKAYSIDERTRSFLKVQDGCNYFCSYCKVPFARGRSRNPSIAEIINQVREIEKHNIKEIVLSGINIGDFGHSTNETFFDLIKALENNTDIPRYRISSIEPNLLTFEMIDFVLSSKRFVPHFHIPLQSGSDEILSKMDRKYTSTQFVEKVNYIRSKADDAAIGIDVIVGFPGETDKHFSETLSLLNSISFSYLHVFEYSDRKETRAYYYENKVTESKKHERSLILRNLSANKKTEFSTKFLKSIRYVLFEKKSDGVYMTGLTDNYINVNVPYQAEFINTIQPVYLKAWDAEKELILGDIKL